MAQSIKKIGWASRQQWECWKAGPDPLLALGGYNAAKTFGFVLKTLRLLDTYANSRIAIVRATFKHLKSTTMETFYALCPPQAYAQGRRSDQEGICTLNNGSTVRFMGLDKPESLNILAGLEINFGFIDQAEQVPEAAWDTLDNRLGRWSHARIPQWLLEQNDPWPWRNDTGEILIPPPYLFATANPPETEDHWLFRRFAEESEERDHWRAQGYRMIHMPAYSNRFATKANLAKLRSKNPEAVRRFYEGLWANPQGAIFTISEDSILDPHPDLIKRIIQNMDLHRSLDHGDSNPTCVLWEGSDHDGNIFVYREHYQAALLVSQHREIVWDLSQGDAPPQSPYATPQYVSDIADPSIMSKSRGRTVNAPPTWSIADEWRDDDIAPAHTAIYWSGAPRSVGDGKEGYDLVTRNRIKEYLEIDPTHRHPVTGKLGAPHLYFIRKTEDYPYGCFYAIKELRGQRRVKIGERDGQSVYGEKRDPTVPDHAYDALKYHVISRPAPKRSESNSDPSVINIRELMEWTARNHRVAARSRPGGY